MTRRAGVDSNQRALTRAARDDDRWGERLTKERYGFTKL